jgi:hypothetical protein
VLIGAKYAARTSGLDSCFLKASPQTAFTVRVKHLRAGSARLFLADFLLALLLYLE